MKAVPPALTTDLHQGDTVAHYLNRQWKLPQLCPFLFPGTIGAIGLFGRVQRAREGCRSFACAMLASAPPALSPT